MSKKYTPAKPFEIPQPEKQPEVRPLTDPKGPLIPGEDPDRVPYENPFETPPYEIPPPGESF